MNILETINSNEKNRRKYEYFLSLGYTKEASAIMTLFTYGNISTAKFMMQCKNFKSACDKIEKAGMTTPRENQFILSGTNRNISVPRLSFKSLKGAFPQKVENICEEYSAGNVFMCRSSVASPLMMEALATDEYEPIEEKSEKSSITSPTSTFRMTTNTASMGVLLMQARQGRKISMSQVRIEEVLNYFDYSSNVKEHEKISIDTALYEKSENKSLLYINVDMGGERKKSQNIVLLLDVSGSMSSNAECTQEAIATILAKLEKGDTFSLITYSDSDKTVYDGFKITSEKDKEKIMLSVMKLLIGGCTFGSAGIETAYKAAGKNYKKDCNNEVILITDGDLNFGITEKGSLKELISEKKKENVFLSVIGTGLWNYKDDKLEILAKNGNGIYTVINNLDDVEENINKRFYALTQVVAKDVKAQVEFNPALVKTHRLLGYENRELSHEDFSDDTVISEPYGLGGHGVALFELEMGEAESQLKYQKAVLSGSNEICEVRIRYKEPLEDVSHEIEAVVYDRETGTKNAELARLLYCVSEKLRGSDKLDEADEEFLKNMLANGKYKELYSGNSEKLTLFVEAMLLNGQKTYRKP